MEMRIRSTCSLSLRMNHRNGSRAATKATKDDRDAVPINVYSRTRERMKTPHRFQPAPRAARRKPKRIRGASIALNADDHAIASRYFEVRGRLRLGATMVDERSLVSRQGTIITTLWRERGAFDRAPLTAAPESGR